MRGVGRSLWPRVCRPPGLWGGVPFPWLQICVPGAGRPGVVFSFFFSLLSLYVGWLFTEKPASRREANETKKTLSGGSLGSCVDEERSQLRELM